MPDSPTVSVIICSRDRAASLSQTISSLEKIESLYKWEALLVDNASTDDTAEVMQKAVQENPHFRTILCTSIGLGAAREFARHHAKGRILAFTDDDCLVDSGYIDELVSAFDRCPDVGVIGGWIGLYNPDHLPLTIDERTDVVRHEAHSFVCPGAFHGANLSFKADALARSGGFDPYLGAGTPYPCEDIEAVARVVARGYAAVFDPHPRVQHDHGRTIADLPKVMSAYSRGRGAYFANRLSDPMTRDACRARWLSTSREVMYVTDLKNVLQESRAAWGYARHMMPLRKRFIVYATATWALLIAAKSWLIGFLTRRLSANLLEPNS